jgi:hypothetical protein
MLTLAEPVPQDQLSAAANQLNHLCQGLTVDGVSRLAQSDDSLMQDMLKLIRDEMTRAASTITGQVTGTQTNVLAEPEFAEAGTQSARCSKNSLDDLLTHC